MQISRILVGLAMLIVLGAPLLFRPEAAQAPENARTLVIITPHIEPLRYEFERAFSDWHEQQYGVPVDIDWRRPGGTSDIRKQLQAEYRAAVRQGVIGPGGEAEPGDMGYDLAFGGGSYEHGQLKRGVSVSLEQDGAERTVRIPISAPVEFPQERLDAWYAENRIGSGVLYDPEGYWFGNALSSFGIAFNRDLLHRLDVKEPEGWKDLTDPRLAGWIALADPRQSGSLATTFESILNHYGWDEGWRVLRAMAANAHSFNASSAKVVLDVSQGEAAVALAIDFYGRYQSQALLEPGQDAEDSRVGFVDPAGAVYIDPDPASMLRGAPHPELARRFIEFTLTEQGQALWQFPVTGEDAPPSELGPEIFELRRLPIRRIMYEKHFDRFIDQVNAYEIASDDPSRGWRGMISPILATSAIDVHGDMRAAWRALNRVRAAEPGSSLAKDLESLFFAFPDHPMADGRRLPLTPEHYDEIRAEWRDARRSPELKLIYQDFFVGNYETIVQRAQAAGY